jgi:proline iminopeptidase
MKHFLCVFAFVVIAVGSLQGQPPSAPAPVTESGFVTVNGARLWWEAEGTGLPIVFVAGGPGCSHRYLQPFFKPLAQHHRLIYFDAFGCGQSDRAASKSAYSFARDVEDLEGLRKALGLEQFVLLGHSYGGMVAQAYALKYPAALRKLVLADTLYSDDMWQSGNDRYNEEVRNQFPEVWAQLQELRRQGLRSEAAACNKLYYEAVPEGLMYLYNPDKALGPLYESNNDVYYAIAGSDADFRVGGSLAGLDFRAQLHTLKMPVLIWSGRFDRVCSPKDALLFKHYAPQARFVMFERSGHLPFVEEPEATLELLGKFLAE